jgi:hypothetical protein
VEEPTAFEEVADATDSLLGLSEAGPIETQKALAEHAHGEQSDSELTDDLDWIPQNYRRDTVEETARVLLQSQKEAQAAMTKAQMERAELRGIVAEQESRLEQLAAVAAQIYEQQAYEPQPAYDYESAQRSPIDTAYLQSLASQAVQQAVLAPQAEAIANEAERLIVEQVPTWGADKARVMQAVAANPSFIAGVGASSDPKEIANALVGAHQAIVGSQPSPELMRTMKMQAQSAVGAGGHVDPVPDSERRWAEIAGAATGKLGL